MRNMDAWEIIGGIVGAVFALVWLSIPCFVIAFILYQIL